MDFLIGGLMERGESGGVGPTFSCCIAKQFHELKVGDRFWYETDDKWIRFTKGNL